MTTLLIDLTDVQAIESVSANADFATKIRPHIIKAQEFDVRPLVGEQFWLDIVQNIGSFTDLLEPTIYSHSGKQYEHPGLKNVIVMYFLARYKSAAPIIDTASGPMYKTNDYSNPVPDKTIAREAAKEVSGAEVFWLRVRDYLDRNKSTYPLWAVGCPTSARLTGNGLRIKKISKQ